LWEGWLANSETKGAKPKSQFPAELKPMASIDSDWRSFFPFDSWRLQQAEACDFLTENFKDANDLFIEAGTGVGKSAIAMAIARWRAAHGEKTYISTTTIGLENQYAGDFHDFGLRQLHAKVNYLCPHWVNCEIGSMAKPTQADEDEDQPAWLNDDDYHALDDPEKEKLHRRRQGPTSRCPKTACAYEVAKTNWQNSYISIANAAYLLTSARFVKDFKTRPLFIGDEAHTLADQIASGYTIEITARDVNGSFPIPGEEFDWLENFYLPFLADTYQEAREQFNGLKQNDPLLIKLQARIRRLELQRINIDYILRSQPKDWVFDCDPSAKFKASPVWASHIAPGLLHRIGRKRIFMSATLPDFARQARWLGIDPENAHTRFLALPSPFPVANRVIYCHQAVQWRFGQEERAYAQLIPVLENILDRHPTQRGIIHVSSYAQANEIVRRSNNPRLLTHHNSKGREEVLLRLFATPGAVLVSPSSREGLDLFGDRSEFQVIAKLPYPSLGDKRVQQRMTDDPGWYGLTTAQALIEACGRSVRNDRDRATTYILDAGWGFFIRRNAHFFPQYFKDALKVWTPAQ
jgi:Rad3-related DNA helicase